MKTRALWLFVGLSIATPLAAEQPPNGGPCPFGLDDPQLRFDEVEGLFTVTDMAPPTDMAPIEPDTGSLPCGYSVSAGDGSRAWIGVDAPSFPRHLVATLQVQTIYLELKADEGIKVIDLPFSLGDQPPIVRTSPEASAHFIPPPTSPFAVSVSVWLTRHTAILAWEQGGDIHYDSLELPATQPFTLALGIDRGRPDPGAFITLSVVGDATPPARLGPIEYGLIPEVQFTPSRLRAGVVDTFPTQFNGERGTLRFRLVAMESGWGRR
jgi:hypothetical protein